MAHKLLVDVNICLDLLLDRRPYVEYSGRIFEAAEKGILDLFISGLSFDTLFYIIRPELGARQATDQLRLLLNLTDVASIGQKVVENALDAGWNDLEDALQYYCAIESDCDFLITRNLSDFKTGRGGPEVVTPEVYVTTQMTSR